MQNKIIVQQAPREVAVDFLKSNHYLTRPAALADGYAVGADPVPPGVAGVYAWLHETEGGLMLDLVSMLAAFNHSVWLSFSFFYYHLMTVLDDLADLFHDATSSGTLSRPPLPKIATRAVLTTCLSWLTLARSPQEFRRLAGLTLTIWCGWSGMLRPGEAGV